MRVSKWGTSLAVRLPQQDALKLLSARVLKVTKQLHSVARLAAAARATAGRLQIQPSGCQPS